MLTNYILLLYKHTEFSNSNKDISISHIKILALRRFSSWFWVTLWRPSMVAAQPV